MDDLLQATEEIRAVIDAIQQICGLQSHWNGLVRLDATIRERGLKPFSCEIVLRADLVTENVRWRTWIHEALHSVSVGYTPHDFVAHRGWEEGVVEQAQRVLRSDLLAYIGVSVDETLLIAFEQTHLFNEYIASLERVRNGFSTEAKGFYVGLLQVPIRDRYASLQMQASSLAGAERARMIRLLAEANATLTRRLF